MILEAINKKPFIHFGLNAQTINARLNDVVVVWNDNFNEVNINTTLNFVKINNNKFEINCTELGQFNIISETNDKQKQQGNTIKLIVE